MGCDIMYCSVQVLELQRKLMLPFLPTLSIEAAGSSENLLPTYQPRDIVFENTEICTCIFFFQDWDFTEVLLKIQVCWNVSAVPTGS